MTTDPAVTAAAEDALTDAVRVALAENGVGTPGSSLHGWRCEYPDRYGECDCVAEVVADVIAAARPIIDAEVRERIAAEIEDEGPWCSGGVEPHGGCRCYDNAARIARGQA